MSKVERYIMRRIIRRLVIQGAHRSRILSLYVMIVEATRDEFTEDNKPTLDAFLLGLHQEALRK